MGKYKATAEAKRAERTVPICLRGDLVADWEAADRELKRAADENRSADSKEGAGLGALAEKVRALGASAAPW
jgi:hypothetical protein